MSTFDELQKTIADFFKVDPRNISRESTAHDVAAWDSFSHMELMSHIETIFQIQLPFTVIMEFSCVGDIAQYLDERQTPD